MSNLNSVIIEGRLLKGTRLGSTYSGKPLYRFTIETVRSERGKEPEVSDFEIEAFGMLCEQFLKVKEDSVVRIVGYLREDKHKDSGGNEIPGFVIAAEHIETRPVYNY